MSQDGKFIAVGAFTADVKVAKSLGIEYFLNIYISNNHWFLHS